MSLYEEEFPKVLKVLKDAGLERLSDYIHEQGFILGEIRAWEDKDMDELGLSPEEKSRLRAVLDELPEEEEVFSEDSSTEESSTGDLDTTTDGGRKERLQEGKELDLSTGIYCVERRLGGGGFGNVYRVKLRRGKGPFCEKEGQTFALKVARAGENSALVEVLVAAAAAELGAYLAAWRLTAFFPELYDVAFIPGSWASGSVVLLMEEAATDLSKYESRYGRSFPQNLVPFVAWAMAGALAHLNRCWVVHGDVKPGNILWKEDPDSPMDGWPVLTDFGTAQNVRDFRPRAFESDHTLGPNEEISVDACTEHYAAPEVLKARRDTGKLWASPRSDMWSWAKTVDELGDRRCLGQEETLLDQCLQNDRENRPRSFEDIALRMLGEGHWFEQEVMERAGRLQQLRGSASAGLQLRRAGEATRKVLERLREDHEMLSGGAEPGLPEAQRLFDLANVCSALGDRAAARELLEQVLAIEKLHFGEEHPRVAMTHTNLAGACLGLGQSQRARELLEQALPIQKSHSGGEHPEVATTLTNLATACLGLGQTQRARELLEQAVPIETCNFGWGHPRVARTLTNLAGACRELGQAQQARELLEQALAIKKRHFGEEHPQVARTLTNLANACQDLGQVHRAHELYEQALPTQKRHFGEEHPEVAHTLGSLGGACQLLGQAQRARELQEQALVIERRHFGEEHPRVARTLTNLAGACLGLGQAQQARELLEQALATQERHFGGEHPKVVEVLTNLANAHQALGEAQRALELHERALAIQERHFGEEHPKVADVLINLAIAWKGLGQYRRGRELLEQALAIEKRHFGGEHPRVAKILQSLAGAWLGLGYAQRARELLEQALAIQERHFGEQHPEVATIRYNLALARASKDLSHDPWKRALLEQRLANQKQSRPVGTTPSDPANARQVIGQAQRMFELHEQALSILRRDFGGEHPKLAATLTNLANACLVIGQAQRMRELHEQALLAQKRRFGGEHPEVAATLTDLALACLVLGQPQRARELVEQALAIQQRPRVVGTTTSDLANACLVIGQAQRMRELHEQALPIQRHRFGGQHPEVAATLTNLALACLLLGEPQRARELVEEALAIQRRQAALCAVLLARALPLARA